MIELTLTPEQAPDWLLSKTLVERYKRVAKIQARKETIEDFAYWLTVQEGARPGGYLEHLLLASLIKQHFQPEDLLAFAELVVESWRKFVEIIFAGEELPLSEEEAYRYRQDQAEDYADRELHAQRDGN